MADDLSVSRVTDTARDGKANAKTRGKRRPPASRPAASENADDAKAEAPKERHLDFLV
jgi:hypothetical protein